MAGNLQRGRYSGAFGAKPPRPRASRVLSRVPLPEWRAVKRYRPHVLIERRRSDAEDTLVALTADFGTNVLAWSDLPPGAPVQAPYTLVVRDVGRLQPPDQARLLALLAAAPEHVQVFATSSEPLYDSVERNAFRSDLYYRLSAVRLVLDKH